MLKFLPLLFLFFTALFAQDKVEIYASSMDTKGSIVEAYGGVTVIYKDYTLSAKRATYNRETGELELFDNIRANFKGSNKILGNYARLNIAKKERLFRPFYMLDKDSKVWLSADEGVAKDKDIDIISGTMSGCDPMDPLWKMEFSSSDYNAKTKWLNLYNTRLYIYDILVLYTPYFGYSLDTTRRTGLLMPSLGLSTSEGFYYEQPVYIAEQEWWDLELNPQIRTNRGAGIYSTFRFVDSKVSHGEVTLGYFQEKDAYALEHNLKNKEHFGYNFLYDNRDVINEWFGTDFSGQSGLYMDLNDMNDVDYINLSSNDSEQQAIPTLVLSRVNLFYNTDDHYFGTYIKYYKDLDKADNTATLQKIPTLQYHHYIDTYFNDHFLYYADVKSNNIVREVGSTVVQTDINIPLTLQANLFDEYINIAYNGGLYMQGSIFSQDSKSSVELKDGHFYRDRHTVSASTQLTKAFDEVTHVMGFGASYTFKGSESSSGYYSDNLEYCRTSTDKTSSNPTLKLQYEQRCEFLNVSDTKDTTQLDFIQYLYDSSAKQILYHRISQNITYVGGTDQFGELENELSYSVTDNISYYNNTFYNYDEKLVHKTSNQVSYHDSSVNLSVNHLYENNFKDKTYTKYLTSTASYRYNKHYYFSALYNYDIEASQQKNMEFGFLYQKRCWDFGIRYAENRRPVTTISGDSFIDDKYLYFNIALKPIMQGGVNNSTFSYRFNE